MNQRLCIGIQELDLSWKGLLNDLGVWFEELDYRRELHSQYSLILLNEKPENDQIPLLKNYLDQGGALLELKGVHVFTDKKNIHASYEKTVIDGSESGFFQHIPFLDLFHSLELHRSSDIFGGMIHFERTDIGTTGFFGADLPELLKSTGYKRKRFYAGDQSSPDEIVSSVSKHELTEVFRSTLAQLHYERELPYIQNWTSPTEKPVFCFRIDSDFGDEHSVKKLYNLCTDHHINATWFLHVEAHESWLDVFHAFKDQEIALHGYKHGTSNSINEVLDNIKKGNELLRSSGFSIDGYCAPYGIWNEALQQALREFNFKYTSEFTFKYDGFPATLPSQENGLQIPVHPICTGSLNRRKYSAEQMKKYFTGVMKNRFSRYEPVSFYHHPLQPGLDVIEYIFEEIKKQDFHNLSFSEYADFWIQRCKNRFEAYYDGNELSVNSDMNTMLQVSIDHNGFYLLRSADKKHDLKTNSKFEYGTRYLPSPKKIKEMRKTDLRLLKTSLWDWKNRIRL